LFEVKTRDLGARIGKLVTRHGVIETPFLFPVVDPKRQVPSLTRIKDTGFNGIITNAYLFYKRNEGIAKPIHSELMWDGIIMTDSGGYQVLVYGDIDVDNKTIVTYEKEIGSDIAVILDVPTGSKMSFEEAYKAVSETYRRGIEALPLIMDSDQLWVYPVQGAPFKDLLVRSAVLANKLPYDIYAIGSPTVMLEKYRYSKLVELVAITRALLPPNKPLHVFGVGHPMIIPFLVAAGGDLFDSASYVLYARDSRYMVETGTKNIKDLSYFPCNCPACSKYTPREVLEMTASQREEFIAIHNLYMLVREIRVVKEAIREGRLWELLEYRSRAHPTLFEAFNIVKGYAKLFERAAPASSPSYKALLIYDDRSFFHPRLKINVRRALSLVSESATNKLVILIPAYKKPYTSQSEYMNIKALFGLRDDVLICFIHPALGVFKPEVSFTYPFYQHEFRITKASISTARIARFVEKIWRAGPRGILIVRAAWFKGDVEHKVWKLLIERGVHVTICRLDEISSLLPP